MNEKYITIFYYIIIALLVGWGIYHFYEVGKIHGKSQLCIEMMLEPLNLEGITVYGYLNQHSIDRYCGYEQLFMKVKA